MTTSFCRDGVAQRLRNGLPRDGPGFDFRWVRCKKRASRPSLGTVNGVPSLNDLVVDWTLNTTNRPTSFLVENGKYPN